MDKRIVGAAVAALALVPLAGCGPSYPDGPKKDAFVNGVEAFCGEGNYSVEDVSGRPLGGPTSLALDAYCIERPADPSEFLNLLKAAFPEGDITEFDDGSFEIDGISQLSENPFENVSVYDLADPERGYEGPNFVTGYRLNDAS